MPMITVRFLPKRAAIIGSARSPRIAPTPTGAKIVTALSGEIFRTACM